MVGTLYVVGTPIGNLEDITLRALRVLKEVDAVACEDTRTTAKLLSHYEIRKPLAAYYGRSGRDLLDRLRRGESIALVSESGTPGVSDPGAALVAQALEDGIPVRAIPGPCALAAAASVSGLGDDGFVFVGFPPKKPGKRRSLLKSLASEERALVFYESPHRVADTLAEMAAILGDRPVTLARELTKIHEEVARTTLGRLAARFTSSEPRGEFVLVVAGAATASPAEPEV